MQKSLEPLKAVGSPNDCLWQSGSSIGLPCNAKRGVICAFENERGPENKQEHSDESSYCRIMHLKAHLSASVAIRGAKPRPQKYPLFQWWLYAIMEVCRA